MRKVLVSGLKSVSTNDSHTTTHDEQWTERILEIWTFLVVISETRIC